MHHSYLLRWLDRLRCMENTAAWAWYLMENRLDSACVLSLPFPKPAVPAAVELVVQLIMMQWLWKTSVTAELIIEPVQGLDMKWIEASLPVPALSYVAWSAMHSWNSPFMLKNGWEAISINKTSCLDQAALCRRRKIYSLLPGIKSGTGSVQVSVPIRAAASKKVSCIRCIYLAD